MWSIIFITYVVIMVVYDSKIVYGDEFLMKIQLFPLTLRMSVFITAIIEAI